MLPKEIVNYILSFSEKEMYWNKYTGQTHIRFTQNSWESLSCLFPQVYHHRHGIRRGNLFIVMDYWDSYAFLVSNYVSVDTPILNNVFLSSSDSDVCQRFQRCAIEKEGKII